MGSLKLRDVLHSLCCGHGWSYGVFWRVDPQDPRLLMMEDSYYDGEIGTLMDNMLPRVHMVGEGTVGEVAISGKHQWIYSDSYCGEWNPVSLMDNLEVFQGNAECQHQFLAGIKTIAVISLLSLGVVQFGSSKKICESLEFIEQVKLLFKQLECMSGLFLYGEAHNAMDIHDPHATFASVISSGDISKERTAEAQPSTGPSQSSSLFSLVSHHSDSMNPHVLAVSAVSGSTCANKSFSNSFQKATSFTGNSYNFTNQCQESRARAPVLLTANTQFSQVLLQSNPSFASTSFPTGLNTTMWDKGNSTLSMMEQRQLSGMRTHELPRLFLTNSHSILPHENALHHTRCDPTSLYSQLGLLGTMSNSGSFENSRSALYGLGKLPLVQQSSPSFPVIEDDLYTRKSFSNVQSYAPELPYSCITFPQDLTLEHSISAHSKADPPNGLTPLISQPPEQVNDELTVPMNENLMDIISESSGLLERAAFSSSKSTERPTRPVENSIAATSNSVVTSCDVKQNTSNAPTQLLSDHDLFDGIELDLSPSTLGLQCWDDIIMPNLSTSISECISELNGGPMVGAEKGLFPESGLEQLFGAVVGGNVNFASSHSSVVTNVNSTASPDSEHQFTTTMRVDCTQLHGNQVSSMELPCRTLDVSLPECNLEKIMNGSSKALLKSEVSSWMDDSYSMNSDSAMVNQPKRPEDALKVARKRARPGESTRPRPKDRQRIQDRVKELREIVPNGGKCSIDALLDRTIKHMLFLQSVTKYADKIKQADEPKMIGDESGIVLKDNSNGGGGGATWAFDVAGQTMVCPIIVEDLNPPGQMLVEMLCEERGFFLEIADIIRGFGLTILKGVMEVRDSKIWARFLVEANRDVTRMDIFLSLVQLLQQASSIRSSDHPMKAIDNGVSTFTRYQQSPMPFPIS